MSIKTTQLYKENPYLRTCKTYVKNVENLHNSGVIVTLKESPFFPIGGGQSCDLGGINGEKVIQVYEENDEVFHIIESSLSKLSFRAGDEVTCVIDWNRRFENMQRHCGEHIISGVFFKMFEAHNKGFHMGEDYMTIDLDLSNSKITSSISWEQAIAAEKKGNEIIWASLPVSTLHLDKSSDAKGLPLRKPLALEKNITLVCVGDIKNPADLVACCGTHPSTSSEVGLIKIYKVEKNKEMFRVYFDAGIKAMEKYDTAFDVADNLARRFSTKQDNLLQVINSTLEEQEKSKKELNEAKKIIAANNIEKIYSLMNADTNNGENASKKALLYTCQDMNLKDFRRRVKKLQNNIMKNLIIKFPKEKSILLFAATDKTPPADKMQNHVNPKEQNRLDNKNWDCGEIAKTIGPSFNGKGGGTSASAQISFSSSNDMEDFLVHIL